MSDHKAPDDKQIDELVENVSDWLAKQPHLPLIEDKKLLTKFLINCKFRLQETKTKIENYYSARTNIPSVFQNRDPTSPEIRRIGKFNPCVPLSQRSKDGYTIIVFNVVGGPDDFVAADYVKRMFMVFDAMFYEETNLDYIVVVDFRGFSFRYFLKFATSAKLFIDIVQNVIPARFKGAHYVHVPGFIDKVVDLFKILLKPKLRERLYVHSNMDTFYDVIGDRDILPSDLGGKQPSIEELNEQHQKKLESYKSWFEKEEQIRSNEDLRPSNTEDSWLTGTEGSFKKLTVD